MPPLRNGRANTRRVVSATRNPRKTYRSEEPHPSNVGPRDCPVWLCLIRVVLFFNHCTSIGNYYIDVKKAIGLSNFYIGCTTGIGPSALSSKLLSSPSSSVICCVVVDAPKDLALDLLRLNSHSKQVWHKVIILERALK